VPFEVVRERVADFLETRGGTGAPLFLYVNFHDTHFPYSHDGIDTLTSPARLPRERIAPAEHDALRATYTNTAANVDRAIGSVLDAVRRSRGAEPGVIITADHGESLFDEGFLGHGYALNDVQTRIPLLVANLPLQVSMPFGQMDLRPAIDEALSGSGDALAPRATRVPGRRIFQYLGTLSRPRQVAFVQDGSRTIYDFRNGRVQMGDGLWRHPGELSAAEREEFLGLIHFWERLMLEQHEDDAAGQP
jgi:arylsulfatase A-like enzyme